MPAATIFIVDDDDLLRLSLRDRLDCEGYALVEAGSCAEATARLTPDLDLVLLDFQLPDGRCQVVRAIRRHCQADQGLKFARDLTLRRQTPSSPRRSPIPASAVA